MPLKTSTAIAGFIVADPILTRSEDGTPRCYLRIGQEHYTPHPDGTFTQEATTFHDLVVYRKTAQRVAVQFKKGDRFLADGSLHTYPASTPDGQTVQREEFVAHKIGHDLAYTRYSVDRTPRVQQGPITPTTPAVTSPVGGPTAVVGMGA
jgi:single-stranded DNA-binding protein